ncbi:MAG TPA: hypothetical protein VGL93_27485 [Streptosporangiaceae bacterium]|jgi:hypothetical protein
MNPVTLVAGFVPLVLFALLDGAIPVAAAAALAAAAAVVAFAAMVRRAVPVLPIVQAVTLAAVSALAFTGGPATQSFLTDYGRGLVSLVLAAYILATAGFAPFTAAFARAGVPREHWHSPRFIGLNRRISAAWGAAVLVLGVSHLLYGAVGASLTRFEGLVLNWGLTIVAVLVAFRYTQRTIAAARTGAVRPPQGY